MSTYYFDTKQSRLERDPSAMLRCRCGPVLTALGPLRSGPRSALPGTWLALKATLFNLQGRQESIDLAQCGLELHPTKTRIVYCKDDDRRGEYEHITFTFLGYTFGPRRAKNRWGKFFVSFLPAISSKAAKAIRATIRGWQMASTRNNQRLEDLAKLVNPYVRGWMNYYGRYYRSMVVQVLRTLNGALAAWVRRKYTRFRNRERASMHWLGRIARRDTKLFVLWQLGVRPEAGS